MNEQDNMTELGSDTIAVGIDWADREHVVCVIDQNDRPKIDTLQQSPQAIDDWVAELVRRFPGKTIAVAIEQSKGPLIHALMNYEQLLLYPINPKQLSRYRDALHPSGCKDDPGDAKLLAQFLKLHAEQLRPWKPDTEATRKLARYTEIRRKIVDERTRLTLQLGSTLKQYFPLMTELFPRKLPLMLARQIQDLDQTIGQLDEQIAASTAKHPDRKIFRALPGAGDALVPRLIVAFGTDRDRYDCAEEIQCQSGIAPVTRRSGKTLHVSRRYACPKFLRQTFHEFADHARKWSTWSAAFYRQKREAGYKHHAAVRALAFKWIRIIFRLWKTNSIYDEAQYIQQLKKRNSPLVKFIENA